MFGSKLGRMVAGRWHHVGYLMTSGLPVASSVTTHRNGDKIIPKFALVIPEETNEFSMVLSSGFSLGILTQDVSVDGLTGLVGFREFMIQSVDQPVKKGAFVSIRTPNLKTMLEAEGLGASLPGNLVCTSGGAAIDGSTTYRKELTCLNGCLQEGSSGDVIVGYFHRLVTPVEDAGNTRVLWEWAGGAHKL